MQNLFELAKIAKEINVKSTDLLTSNNNRGSKANTLYQKILSQEFTTDAEASAYLFQSNSNHTGYKNLKYHLREKLINTFFFYTPKKSEDDFKKAVVYCTKYYMAGRLLLMLGAKGVGMDLCQKVFKKALDFELTEFILLSCKELKREVSFVKGSLDKYHFYNNKYKEYKEISNAEDLADDYYFLLVSKYTKSVAYQSDISKTAERNYIELKPYLEKYNSPRLHLIARSIHAISFLNQRDYLSTINVCEDALAYYKSKTYTYNTAIRIFFHQLLTCYIQLKNYNKGKEVAQKVFDSLTVGTYSWYIHQELLLVLALHSKEYNEAYHIIQNVTSHYKFKTLRQDFKERWQINKTYIKFLSYINKIEGIDNEIQQIRIGKFLNSVPTYSKDKRGMNIPILIIQILFLLVKKDYDQIIDRIEAIQKYCSRYLRKDDNLRSNCFINMLLQIPKANFNRIAVERKVKKYYDKLLTTPLEVANQAHEIEIIPYEDLWEFVLESLESKTNN